MIPVLRRYAGLLAAGLLALVVLGPLAVFAPATSALALGALAAVAAGLAQTRAATLKARCDKLSGEVDLLSRRLLKAETAAAPPRPEGGDAALRAEVEELTVELGLLSGIVRDLTHVVGTQDSEIASLKARPEPRPEPLPTVATPQAHAEPARTQAPPEPERPASPSPQNAAPSRAPIEPRPIAQDAPPEPVPAPRPIPPRPVPRAPAPWAESEAEIVRAFEADALEIHLQPVVTLPQRKVTAYEALARLRVEGRLIEPEAFLPALERYGRTTELDRRMLQRAAIVVRHLARRGSETMLTYGLSPLSLFEPGLLRELARNVAEDPALAGLAIALPQASWHGLDGGQRGLLLPLRGRIGFSLDRADDLRFDVAQLAGLGVGQVKVPAEMLLRPGSDRRRLSDIAIEDLAPALARAGIRLVATGVTDEADVPDLIDLDVPYAQGAAFAAPRPVRAEVLAAPPPEAPAPSPPAEPEPERRPFRSVLRRAV
ncbi:EAL domain-containing protein [Methylobacterium sp. E-066]|uniref:EAL domain-containing protein n=1 Tax=Methylobacterium sp. E-066 TaxID=2836584 RepID=UPI001FBBD14B|nr:EAL domain-containing protein [Methylobacterium sp. E-066]MCJ2141192.1 EAL domain-containing protein [Methylobacterium sp. E-066]